MNRLVSTSLGILRLLMDKNMYYNEIMRQTSHPGKKPDRTHIDNVIDTLEGGMLIMNIKLSKRERKEQKIHSQARMMQITDLGRELMHLVDKIRDYNEAFVKFERCRIENIDMIGGGDHTPNMLRSAGWSQEETDMYDKTWFSTYELRAFLIRTIFNVLISRYALMVERINNIAKDVLNQIVTIEISNQLSVISMASEFNTSKHAMNVVSHDLTETLDEEIPEFFHNSNFYLNNHIIIDQVKDVIASLLCLVYPRELVERIAQLQISALKCSMKQLEQKLPTMKNTKKPVAELRGDKELLDIFERLLNRSH